MILHSSPSRLLHKLVQRCLFSGYRRFSQGHLVSRPLLTPVAQKLYRCELGLFASRTCDHSRTLFRIEIVCCCSWSIYQCVSWQGTTSKTTVHRLATGFRDTRNIFAWQVLIKRLTSEITAVPVWSTASGATTRYGIQNWLLPLVSSLVAWRCLRYYKSFQVLIKVIELNFKKLHLMI
jgi:hypothetical protein